MRLLSRCFRLLFAVLATTLLAAGSAARAQPEPAEADLQAATRRAEALSKQGKVDEAIEAYRRAVSLAARVYGREGDLRVVPLLNDLAALYQSRVKYEQAEFLYRRALRIREDNLDANHADVVTSLNNLAVLYDEQGQYAKAEPFFRRGLRITEARLGKDHPDVAAYLDNLARLSYEQGEYDRAEPLYQRSLQIYESKLGKDHPDVALCLNNLAALYAAQGQDARAEPLLQRSLQIREARLGKDHPAVAQSLHNLATLYSALGQYGKAEPLFLRSLQIREARLGKDHPDVAISLNNLAALYWDQGEYGKAEPLYQRSLQIYEARRGKDHPDVALSLHNLANLYRVQGAYARAEPLFQRSLRIWEDNLGKDHPKVATTLGVLAELYREQGQYDKAQPLNLRSLQIREEKLGKDHPDVAEILGLQARLLLSLERWTAAFDAADRGSRVLRRHTGRILPALSDSEQLTFLRTRQAPTFHEALSLGLLRRDAAAAALSAGWVLNGKAVAQQALTERTLLARDSTDPHLAEVAARLQAVRRQLATLTFQSPPSGQEGTRRRQSDRLAEQEHDLVKRLGQLGGRSDRADPWVELAEVRRALPADAVLVEIARFPVYDFKARGAEEHWQRERYAAWVIPPAGEGEVCLLDLGEAERIEAAVQALRQALQESPRRVTKEGEPDSEQELRRPLAGLSGLVLRPLLEHIGKAKRWLLSPDADLWLMPWAALPIDEKGRYTIEDYQISYVVSGRDLVRNADKAATGRPVILADPDYDLKPRKPADGETGRGALPRVQRLPGTAAEARAIAPKLAHLAGVEPRVYLREQALEEVVKAQSRPRVLVLSTHGFFLEDQAADLPERAKGRGEAGRRSGKPAENPLLRCGLLLAGCNQRGQAADGADDGVLTGLEIAGTDLRGTELVVLSACATGLGQVHNGEGVAGLRQAFQLAGARSVLATLWSVEDRETARLMVAFFAALADGKGKAEALRAAQLQLIEARRARGGAAHPFFWAAFTVTGDSG
jgi:CHAT domain-containing protein/Tfp pilus assembly protein PilF